jgi:hypothetical protein
VFDAPVVTATVYVPDWLSCSAGIVAPLAVIGAEAMTVRAGSSKLKRSVRERAGGNEYA